ncbi:nicastrin [Bacillus rossius redtenbacheri]|uniref:nicastrin n=1 Tax=Bacillus rossius redtenbacheri TaxID=93214 RepID=UPI002FDE27F0
MFGHRLLVWCLIFTGFLVCCRGNKDNMYERINGVAVCFRRLNGTHQFGCSSERGGNVGVIHFVQEVADRDWLLENGTNEPYMAVLPPKMFTWDIMMSLKESNKVSGVVLFDNGTASDKPGNFSHEDVCPNRYSGLSSAGSQTCSDEKPWNPFGTGLMLVDWGFPMFFTDDKDNISALHECYKKFNAASEDGDNNPLCALQMNSFMFAAVDSKTCVRRSSIVSNLKPVHYCDALGDRNVWWSLFPRSKRSPANENGSVIVVAARMDGTSMFDGRVPGAVAPVSALATLLATAHFLSHMMPAQNPDDNGTNVLFVLFNGESYDYIGSGRMLWDMQQGRFPAAPDDAVRDQPPPLEPGHVGLFVELGQLGRHAGSELYFHSSRPKNSLGQRALVEAFMNQTSSVGAEYGLSFSSVGGVPPSSLQTFLAADASFPGLVVTSHGDQFNNRFYHSIYDNVENVDYTYQNGSSPQLDSIQTFLTNVSFSLATSLYNIITKKSYRGDVAANATLVDELLHCYLDTPDCPMFRAATFEQKLPPGTQSLYVGVNVWPNVLTSLTGQLLAWLTHVGGSNRSREECHGDWQDQVYQYIWMSGDTEEGMCVETTMNYSTAISPAFLIPDYDWSSGKYSTWTESVWQELSVRMFLKPSRNVEILTFTLGVCIFITSFVVVFLMDCRSHILFGNMPSADDC